jgi:hypothetical protein
METAWARALAKKVSTRPGHPPRASFHSTATLSDQETNNVHHQAAASRDTWSGDGAGDCADKLEAIAAVALTDASSLLELASRFPALTDMCPESIVARMLLIKRLLPGVTL